MGQETGPNGLKAILPPILPETMVFPGGRGGRGGVVRVYKLTKAVQTFQICEGSCMQFLKQKLKLYNKESGLDKTKKLALSYFVCTFKSFSGTVPVTVTVHCTVTIQYCFSKL